MKWLEYLLEANLYLALFYAVYYLLLRRDTYYQLNRIYLLTSSVMAFIIPLLQIGILKPVHIAAQSAQLTAAYVVPTTQAIHVDNITATPTANINYCLMFYLLVALGLTIAFGVRLYQLVKLARKGRYTPAQNFNMIEIDDEDHAFSFFNYLFIGKQISTSPTIIQHELVHIRQKHSIDIVYLELIKIICWFNPVVYLLQNSIKAVHEFIADNHIAHHDINSYTDFLISNAYGLSETNLTNNFFNKNLLKTRIMMLHQKRSGNLARLKYLVALPLLAGMLCLSTLGFTKNYRVIDLIPADGVVKLPPPPPASPTSVKRVILPPPPPTYINQAYLFLASHLYNTAIYPKSGLKDKIDGTVLLGFRINDNGKMDNVTVIRGLGYDFDDVAVKAMSSYTKTINYKPGDYTFGIDFMIREKMRSPIVASEISSKPNFMGEVVITDIVDKRTFITMAMPNKGKFPPSPPAPASVASASNVNLSPPPPLPKATGPNVNLSPPPPANTTQAIDTTNKDYPFASFYKYIGKHVRYPAAARSNNIQGKVFVVFNVDEGGNVANVGVLRGLTSDINNEIVRVVKAYKPTADFKTGINYTMPVFMGLRDEGTPSGYVDSKPNYANYPKTDKPNDYEGYKKTGFPNFSLNEVVVIGYPAIK